MEVAIGDSLIRDFTIHDPTIGSVCDADQTLCSVFEDDTDVPIYSPVVTKRNGQTGQYRVLIDISEINFDVSKNYNVMIQATVGSITAKTILEYLFIVRKRAVDIVDILLNCIKNKKYLEKVGSTWFLVVRDETDAIDIIRKALKDKNENDVTDIQAGVLAKEMISSV